MEGVAGVSVSCFGVSLGLRGFGDSLGLLGWIGSAVFLGFTLYLSIIQHTPNPHLLTYKGRIQGRTFPCVEYFLDYKAHGSRE